MFVELYVFLRRNLFLNQKLITMDLKTKIKQCEDSIRDCEREKATLSHLTNEVKSAASKIDGISGITNDFIRALAKRIDKIDKRKKSIASDLASYNREFKLAEAKKRYKASKAEYRRLRRGW